MRGLQDGCQEAEVAAGGVFIEGMMDQLPVRTLQKSGFASTRGNVSVCNTLTLALI